MSIFDGPPTDLTDTVPTNGFVRTVVVTQAEYDDLDSPDSDVLYVIVG